MTTPAGWYDDGSGRQRWWDGQQWTEHFAPETAQPAAPEATVPAESAQDAPVVEPAADPVAPQAPASDVESLDDTVVRPNNETVIVPESGSDPFAPPSTAAGAAAYPPPAPNQGGYPGAAGASSASGGYGTDAGYPGAAPTGVAQPEGPKKLSVLGLVGLGLAVLGTILVFIPVIGVIGFFLLAAAFIVSLISLFLKGKKWPGIAGLSLAVVGTIIGLIMSAVYLVSFAQGVSNEIDDLPSASPSAPAAEPEETEGTDGETGAGRPSVEEVAVGLTDIISLSGESETYTEEQITCIAEGFVASDIPDDTLAVIATGQDMVTDADAVAAFSEQFAESGIECLTQ